MFARGYSRILPWERSESEYYNFHVCMCMYKRNIVTSQFSAIFSFRFPNSKTFLKVRIIIYNHISSGVTIDAALSLSLSLVAHYFDRSKCRPLGSAWECSRRTTRHRRWRLFKKHSNHTGIQLLRLVDPKKLLFISHCSFCILLSRTRNKRFYSVRRWPTLGRRYQLRNWITTYKYVMNYCEILWIIKFDYNFNFFLLCKMARLKLIPTNKSFLEPSWRVVKPAKVWEIQWWGLFFGGAPFHYQTVKFFHCIIIV